MRARGDNLLPDQFQTVAAVLAFDWCKKLLCFSAQSEGSRPWNPFCVFLHAKYMKESAVRHVYLGCSRRLYTRRWKDSMSEQNPRENVREYLRLSHRLMPWTFRRYQHCLKIKANSANASWTLAWENIRNLAVFPFMLFLGAGKPISNLQNV